MESDKSHFSILNSVHVRNSDFVVLGPSTYRNTQKSIYSTFFRFEKQSSPHGRRGSHGAHGTPKGGP